MQCYMDGSWGVSTQASSHTHQLNWQSSILKFLFLLLSKKDKLLGFMKQNHQTHVYNFLFL